MKIHEKLKQGTPEWFAVRLGKFTASKAQAIGSNGAGLKTLCFEKAAEKISGTRQDTYTNPDMERGNEQEKLARMSYELKSGLMIKEVGFIESDEHAGCSPDGLVGEDGMVEIKCPTNSNFVKVMYNKKPDSKYVWQMQMQMLVSGRKWVDFVVFNENFEDIFIIRIDRDEEKIEKLKTGLETGIKRVAEILEGVK